MYTTLRMGMRPCEVIPKHDITRWVYKGAGGGREAQEVHQRVADPP
jgi:hypothetical protein